MAQMQKVSWRTVGYAALGTTAIIAATIGIVHSDGVRPASLKSNAATRWLVYQPKHLLVLADGLSGHVLAKIDASKSEASDEIAVQGAGGAFLVSPSLGSVRAVSTANLQLGTPQVVRSLSAATTSKDLGVGASGLTVVNTKSDEANIVPTGDITRPIKIPQSDKALVARDGSLWLFTATQATHVNVDETSRTFPLRGATDPSTTIGTHAVTIDRKAGMLRWLDGGDVSIASIPNSADAVLQRKGDDKSCVWLGAGDTLACVGPTAVEHTVPVPGLNLGATDTLAVAGSIAVVVRSNTNRVQRVDLDDGTLLTTGNPERVPVDAQLTITAVNGMIWIDEEKGATAWVISEFGVQTIDKNDTSAPTVNAQGQVTDPGSGDNGATAGQGNAPGNDAETDHLDHNGVDDPPHAVDDSVTARAGTTVTIPVTGNDWDPDGNAIAVMSVGDSTPPGHGTADVLDGTSVTYVPTRGFSGADEFDYTIVDENGNRATATVHLQLFPPDSPNRPPIATPDHVKTRLGRAVTIDVLANDIDPERDTLTVPTFADNGPAKITDTSGPTGLPALRYEPPTTPGIYAFTYQAADPQGGTSEKTMVTVDVLGESAPNEAPIANPDAIRLLVGKKAPLDVKANDVDPDGDELKITVPGHASGVDVKVRSEQLDITLQPGAAELTVVEYSLSDGIVGHEQIGRVLVVRIGDTAPNRPPIANPDANRVVVGNSVSIAVTANDADPENDPIRLLSAAQPTGGVGTTTVEGNSVRFTPNLPNITEPTPVTFTYKIGDGHNNTATGTVTVTVLVEALPRAPFARDDFADTFTDKPVNIDVLANDTDPSGGTPSIVGQPVCPNGGKASTTADQRVTFTPPLNQIGNFRCKYRVSNTQGEAEAWIIVTVTAPPPGNHAPEWLTPAPQPTVSVGGSVTLSADSFASDIDNDSLVFASVSTQGVGTTSFSQKAASFTYTAPLAAASDTPTLASLEVTITDGHDGYVRNQISIKIVDNTPAPPTPPSTSDIPRITSLDQPPVVVDVLTLLSNQNEGATLSLRSATVDSGLASVSTRDGIVTITPSAAGVVVVTYTVVNNANQLAAPGTITVTVNPAPVFNPPAQAFDDVLTISSGGSGSVNVLQNDLGLDVGDKPFATLLDRPPASFGIVRLESGILKLIANPDGLGKTATIHYSVTDGFGPPSTGSVDLTIMACLESPPVALAGSDFTPYGTPYYIDLGKFAPSGVIIPASVEGAGLTGPTGWYNPPTGMNDSVTVTFLVENGCGQTAPGQFTLDVNLAPVAKSITRELTQGSTLTLLINDIASDNEPLTMTLAGNPSWVTLGAGAGGTVINVAPPAGTASGTYSFPVTVTDLGGLSAVATVNLIISNLPPTAVADAYSTDGSLLTFDPTVNDTDTEPGPLNVQTVAAATGSGTVQGRTGNLITVSVGHGVSTFDYTIVDSGGLTSSSTITITSNRPPTMDPITVTSDQPTFDADLTPIDPDGDPLTVTCESPPLDPNGQPYFDVQILPDPEGDNPNKVKLHFTINNGWKITAIFGCTAIDPFGEAAHAQVSLSAT